MTDPQTEKTNDSTQPEVSRPIIKEDSPSWMDSVFLSPIVLISMTVFVVIATIIMGWFVFDSASSRDWILKHDGLIKSAKNANNEFMALRDTIPELEVTKGQLLLEVAEVNKDLSRRQNQLNTVTAQIDERSAVANTLQDQIAIKQARLGELGRLVPEAEQSFATLNARERSLKADLEAKRSEYNQLDGQAKAAKAEYDEIQKRIGTISSIEHDFTQIQSELESVLTRIGNASTRVENTSSNFASQVTGVAEQSQKLTTEIDAISDTQTEFGQITTDLQISKAELSELSTQMRLTQTSLQESSTTLSALAAKLDRIEESILNLTQAIQTSNTSLTDLNSDAKGASKSILDKSNESVEAMGNLSVAISQAQTELNRIATMMDQLQRSIPTPTDNN